MPEPRQALERLAARFGIAAGYHDITGRSIEVADSGLIALLAAFGVDATTPSRVAEADRAADAASWQEVLPPVLAVPAGQQGWSLVLRLPASLARLHWTLTEEHGREHHGDIDPAALPEVAVAPHDGIARRACRLTLALALAPGYHRLRLAGLPGQTCVIAAPPTAHLPAAVGDAGRGRVWGVAVQLYALRSADNWGIGDFADLERLAEQWAPRGADLIGLNPLHALFTHNPAHASPYSPSSRQHLNVLYIAVEAIDGFAECEAARRLVHSPAFQARLQALRDAPLVDHAGVAAAKFEALALLYAHFQAHDLARDSGRARAFRAFCAEGGVALQRHALFEALQAHWHARDPSVWGWPAWPAEYHDPAGDAAQAFAREHAGQVQWHAWLQWLARRQLARAAARCRALGMSIGLYLDLAVSVDRAGSDVWAHRDAYARDASVGAPPDAFNADGQGWGLPPLRPDALRASGHQRFAQTLRAAMRDAGALRIDHVMGLMRLFWIPPGHAPRDGAYVHYPLDELLAVVALESRRQQCLVVGEDLGTVPDEVRAAMARTRILSCRLLYFERGDGERFKPPGDYPRDALVAVGTHDLPTLAGWWSGEDLRLRQALSPVPPDAQAAQQAARGDDRVRLLRALQQAGRLPPEVAVDARTPLSPALLEAIHGFLAATPSRVMLVQMEDALGIADQVNLPGTTDEHPNWRRKLPPAPQGPGAGARLDALAAAVAAERPRRAPQARIPRATYRLQFHKDFDFDAALRILPYLARLGVSHVYGSPVLRARPGSTHGYDIVAHDEINPELGGRPGFDRFTEALAAHGMGLVLDIVPNHMGVLGADNAWWMDVLESGPAAEHAHHFDIDWHPANPELEGKVLLPLLGAHYGEVLDRGELVPVFERDSGALVLRYHEHRLPFDPRTCAGVLAQAARAAGSPAVTQALEALAAASAQLPPRGVFGEDARVARRVAVAQHKARVANAAARQPALADALDSVLAALNADGPRDALHELIEAQAWRVAYWRVAADEINYRRFFDINDLAALRMEDEDVFEATHGFVLDLAAAGRVDGLRIDHPDGLRDPAQYFHRLQAGYARRAGLALPAVGEDGRPPRPLYVVVEKIAAPHEDVPLQWAVHGTTGYRFANLATGVLVDRTAHRRMQRIWHDFSGVAGDFGEQAWLGKRTLMASTLAAELTVLATELLRIARADRHTRDYTYNALRAALAEAAACLPVYRTYIVDTASIQDQRYIDWAIAQARRRSRAADTSIFDFVRRCLLAQSLDEPAHARPGAGIPTSSDTALALPERIRRFAMRFQQFSAPVAAKGVEDTAFYRYSRLVSLNEVGGDPGTFGLTVRAFHGATADRAAHWPHTMLATSTHDNKRSEDVRCRIDVLSERSAAWRLALRRWRLLNRSHRSEVEGASAPSAADEILLYQTLLGTLPAEPLDDASLAAWRERIERYMLKAAREAKLHTSWISPDDAYEDALQGFVRGALGRLQPNLFLDELRAFGEQLAWFGALNSLSTVLLKFTAPGVPDLYQGNELMDLSLVDPDNRRPVDYARRERLLDELAALHERPDRAEALASLAAAPHDGRAKLWLTWRLLQLRRDRPALFRDGGYTPLQARGERAAHVIAYGRGDGDERLIVIAGRLFAQWLGTPGRLPLGDAWGDTSVLLPSGSAAHYEDLLTGRRLPAMQGRIRLADAFAVFPGAALLPGA